MTKPMKRATKPEGQLPPAFTNPFTRHLAGGPPLIDVSDLEHSATMSRRQTAAVSRVLQGGGNLSLPSDRHTPTRNRTYFAPVVGREGSQADNDRRARNSKASMWRERQE